MISLDLAGAAVKLYQLIRQDRELQDWVRLILGTCYSGFIALTGICGTSLAAGKSPAVSLGLGLAACSASVLGVLLRDPRARALMLSVPQPIVKDYQNSTGQTTIEPVSGKK